MSIQYKQTDSLLIEAPLWWHKQGLQQTASGYGSKLTTPYKVEHNGRLYRVYCVCFSNAGTLYILPKGEPLYLADSTIIRP
jgi:hypothetical protein